MECMRLRVKDIDFDHHQIIVRGGKGDDDCFTILPNSAAAEIKHILQDVKALDNKDLQDGYGETVLPNALGVKYKNAGKEWIWQYIFPRRGVRSTRFLGLYAATISTKVFYKKQFVMQSIL